MRSFDELLLHEVLISLGNNYTDNFDFYRFRHSKKKKLKFKSRVKRVIKNLVFPDRSRANHNEHLKSFEKISPYLDGIRFLYEILEDEASKSLLVQIMAYRIMGYKKYKLPLSTPSYWKGIKEISKLTDQSNYIKVRYGKDEYKKLHHINLNSISLPIEIYHSAKGVYNSLYVKQYEYKTQSDVEIRPLVGDVVLDCGACWGENAIFFANQVGKKGHVYSFEFIPGNIEVFYKNINLNPTLKERISLIDQPLSDKSDQELFYVDRGPASKVSSEAFNKLNSRIKTITIDDIVESRSVDKVDFIKMDIEGAELPALKGATGVLKRFKPKLAISLYHSIDDFVNIPEYLQSLNLGYSFYLTHGTIHAEETVLIATSNDH